MAFQCGSHGRITDNNHSRMEGITSFFEPLGWHDYPLDDTITVVQAIEVVSSPAVPENYELRDVEILDANLDAWLAHVDPVSHTLRPTTVRLVVQPLDENDLNKSSVCKISTR